MKRNDIKQLHTKTLEELQAQQTELEQTLAKSRLEKRAGTLENTRLSLLADDLARVKTLISVRSRETTAGAAEEDTQGE